MAKLDIPGKDYFKDPHVIASLAETVLFSCRLRIESDDVQLVDTVEAKIAKDGEKHKDRINDVNSRITLHLDGNEVPVLFHVLLLPCLICVLLLPMRKREGHYPHRSVWMRCG